MWRMSPQMYNLCCFVAIYALLCGENFNQKMHMSCVARISNQFSFQLCGDLGEQSSLFFNLAKLMRKVSLLAKLRCGSCHPVQSIQWGVVNKLPFPVSFEWIVLQKSIQNLTVNFKNSLFSYFCLSAFSYWYVLLIITFIEISCASSQHGQLAEILIIILTTFTNILPTTANCQQNINNSWYLLLIITHRGDKGKRRYLPQGMISKVFHQTLIGKNMRITLMLVL